MPKSMKDKLAAGELVLCLNLRLARSVDIAMVAQAGGYDAIYVDMQHVLLIGSGDLSTDYGIAGQVDHPRLRAAFERVGAACRAHGRVLGVRHNVALQGELIRLGARFVIADTDVNYVLAGARQDAAALRAIPLG